MRGRSGYFLSACGVATLLGGPGLARAGDGAAAAPAVSSTAGVQTPSAVQGFAAAGTAPAGGAPPPQESAVPAGAVDRPAAGAPMPPGVPSSRPTASAQLDPAQPDPRKADAGQAIHSESGHGEPSHSKAERDKEIDLDPEPPVSVPRAAPTADGIADKPPEPAKAQVVEEPLAVINAAIKRALDKRDATRIRGANAAERRAERKAIGFFYAARGFAPLWSADAAPVVAVASVIDRLVHADDDALTPVPPPASLTTTGAPDDIAESDVALSEAVVSYARQATGSRIDPLAIGPLVGFKRPLADASDALESVVAAKEEAGNQLRAFNPIEPRYAALRDKLAELRALRAPSTASRFPAGPALKGGMQDPRTPLIRSRFGLDGSPGAPAREGHHDTQFASAALDDQREGDLASGVLTRRAVATLSAGQPSRLEGDLVANMEMWRWLPRELGTDRIEVNVPEFTVSVFRDGAIVSRNRVVVGKKTTPTPLFANTMRYLIVNPVWNVPESIIKKEMLPKLADDPDYLDRLGYTVTEKGGRLTVQQPGGEKNALGRIKFMFPNDYAVYLHDTPSKALFASAHRAFSHGCVRVDQPFRFGETVLGADHGWSEKRLKAMLGDKEHTVNLPKPLPIYIEYFTASVDATGHLDLRDDVYDYTRKVEAALSPAG